MTTRPIADDLHAFYGGQMLPGEQVAALRALPTVFPTRIIRRGGAIRELPPSRQGMPALRFVSNGKVCDLFDYVSRNRNAGLLVLKQGKIVFEHYEYGNDRTTHWPSMSIAKSVTSTLVGAAIQDRLIDGLEDRLTRYLPVLGGSGYDGVSISPAFADGLRSHMERRL